MGLFCNFRCLGTIMMIGLMALVYLYGVTASPAILLVVAMPGVLGVAFRGALGTDDRHGLEIVLPRHSPSSTS